MDSHNNIKKFYNIDGVDYGYRRWERNPVAKFDYNCTKEVISDHLSELYFDNALEVGCGPGTWTKLLKEHSKKIVAVDISKTMIEQAKQNNKDPNIQFINSDIMNFQTDKKFDIIFSIRAFEYIKDKELFLKQCFKMLNPHGKLFIITKTKGSYWYGRTKIRKLLRLICPFLFYYENKITGKNVVENLTNFWQERLLVRQFISFSKRAGFTNFIVRPVVIRPPIFIRGKSEIPIIPRFL